MRVRCLRGWPRMREAIELQTVFGKIRGWRRAGLSPSSPRLLAFHGWLDNADSFVPLEPYLRDYELVAIDQIGQGRSDHLPLSSDYTALTFTRCGIEVADALGWSSFNLLGHSLGSVVASLVAAAIPSRVESLIAIEALGALTNAPELTAEVFREAIDIAYKPRRPLRAFPSIDDAIRVRAAVNHLSEPVARLLVERGINEVDDGFVWSSDPRLTHPTAFRLTEAQAMDLIEGIECPTRVILADPPQSYFPDAIRRKRVAALRHGSLRMINGTHHVHMEEPEAVMKIIR